MLLSFYHSVYKGIRMLEFEKYLHLWNLSFDGSPLLTHSSKLLPVRYKNIPAMLKIAMTSEESSGGKLMVWWNGEGAARILDHEGDALLMERAIRGKSLTNMVKNHQDDEASRIICNVVAELHVNKKKPLPSSLVPLSDWFRALEVAATQQGGIFIQAAAVARELLTNSQEEVVLHGDIHHDNILDFGDRGWLAIDPKGLFGERYYDYANIFCNPNIEVATAPGRLEHQVTLIAKLAGLERARLLKWIVAYAGLSAAWHLEDGDNPELPIAVAQMALSALNRCSIR